MSLKQSDFVHLHVHSDYSLLDGMAKVGRLAKKAKECGQAALALTDHGTVSGSMSFYKACKKAGIKPILGCELYLTEDMRKRKRGYNHLTVLAKNQVGWKNLSRISSLANLEGFYYKPRIDFEMLAKYSEGLIVLSGCLKGPVPVLLQQEKYEEAKDSALRFKDVFGDDFFLEIQPNSLEQQVVVNDGCLKIARDLEIPTVATCDLHYIEPGDAPAQEVRICIKSGKKLSDENRLKMKEDFFFHSSEQMISAFRHCPESILSTREIADRVEDYDLLPGERNEYYLPNFTTPDGSETEDYFDATCEAGLIRRYGEEPTSAQRERLEYEKGVIRKLGFTTYFLIVADFIDWARKNGCAVGPGRGSAAGSIVAYCLWITDIDPLRYDLLFERFLNPSRVSMPDIDVDFCEANRPRVIEYVREKYGTENVCQIITFGTLKPKAVIKDVGRVLEIPYSNVEKISKMIPDGPKLKSLQQAYSENPELGALREDPAYQKLFDMAERLEGINRHEGKHAAGVVISDMDLVERIPLTLVKGDKTTQFTMMEVEEAGLLKMDFLGLRTLTLIEDALKLLRKRGIELDMDTLPLDDPKPFEMLSRGDSRGVFQLESSGFRKLLKGAKPDRFEDIIALIALYRPGPLGSDMDKAYISRKHGREPVTYLTDLLAPILDETYGCILYQEQVMRIANVIAGLSMSDADNLRKAMGKKKLDLMNRYKPQFIEGFVAKGVKAEVAEEVWTQIAFFAEYGFNKSHSAAYGLVTYRTAYLKAHYPAEFMAATLTSWLSYTDRILEYAADCDHMGIELQPPDVNQSDVKFDVRDGRIIYGLAAIKGLGEGAAAEIVATRERLEAKGESFRSIFHFCEEVDTRLLNKSALESLVKGGAFDSLGSARSQLAAVIERAMQMGVQAQKDKLSQQTSLFGGASSSGPDIATIEADLLPKIDEWRDADLLAFEKEALGYYLTKHPLDNFKEVIERYASAKIGKLSEQGMKAEVTIGGLITNVRHHLTAKGKQMAFVTLEDFTGTCDVVVFPSIYADVRNRLITDTVVFVQGKVDTDREPPSVLADKMLTVEEAEGALRVSVSAELILEETTREMIGKLRELFIQHRGDDLVYYTFLRERDDQKAGPFRVGGHLKVKGTDALKGAMLEVLGPSTRVHIGARL